MKITLKQIKVKDIAFGYIDNNEEGVYGYGGNLKLLVGVDIMIWIWMVDIG